MKAAVVRLSRNGSGEYDIEEVRRLPTVEADAIDAANAGKVADAVVAAKAAMPELPGDRIAIVASSGVAGVPAARDAVSAAVLARLGAAPAFVSAEDEARFTFDGVVNKVRLGHRRGQVMLLDQGSGNTKGGYLSGAGTPAEAFHPFQIAIGTKTLRQRVDASHRPDEPMSVTIDRILGSDVADALAALAMPDRQAMIARSRIYLNGGIAWLVASLRNPASTSRYVPLTVGDLAAVDDGLRAGQAAQLSATAQATTIADPDQRKLIQTDLGQLQSGKVFTDQEMLCGVALLRFMADRLGWTGKPMFFARPGRVAWIIGYAYSQAAPGGALARVVLPE